MKSTNSVIPRNKIMFHKNSFLMQGSEVIRLNLWFMGINFLFGGTVRQSSDYQGSTVHKNDHKILNR
jgi:hypothetical protein